MYRLDACFVIAGAAFLLTLPVAAQTFQSTPSTFTASTELVVIPTVVNDKSGVRVTGLRKEEFVLKQDGKSHPIAVFEEVTTNSARVNRSAGEHGIFSNFETASGDYHRLNIIVVDFLNTPFLDQANARSELLKFLSDVADSNEPMCLLVLARGGLTLLHDFTDDPKLLAAALRKGPQDSLEGMLATQMVAAHTLAMTCMSRAALQDQSDFGVEVNINRATKLMRTFVVQTEALSRYRGKGEQKMVVEHVHVHKGGQAIVGSVGPGISRENSECRSSSNEVE